MSTGGPTAQPVRTAALAAFAVRPSRIYLRLVTAAALALLASAAWLLDAGHWLAGLGSVAAAAAAWWQGSAVQARWPARLRLDRRRGTLTIDATHAGRLAVHAARVEQIWLVGGACVLLIVEISPRRREPVMLIADSMPASDWARFVRLAAQWQRQLQRARCG